MINTEYAKDISRHYEKAEYRAAAQDYVWATNALSKRQGMSSYLIRSIAQRHGGDAHIDFFRQSVDINVPDEKKIACTREIQEKVDLPLN